MHKTSELYKEIVADRFHKVECKLLIDGVEYGENTLVSVETENNLFAEEAPSCGNAVSGTITAKLRTPNTVIRTKAKMELFARVTSGDLKSEWIPKGVYFIDTREKQKAKNGEDTIIVLDGFDAMLFGEQDYTPSGNWPKSDAEVVGDMCWLLGVKCAWHPNKNFQISKPVGYSVREILGYIAAMYGGSVTINDSGKLQFIGLRQNSNGKDVVFSRIYVGDKLAPITKVILHKMDGNKFTAGDDSGRTLNVDSPWATQESANYILETVHGYKYQPFTASNVIVDPAVEIGDVLNFGGTGKCCYQQDTVYGKDMISTMGAMEEKEINHDYKYISSDSRSTSRALSGYGSALSNLEKKQEELSDSFGVELGSVRSALDVYVKETDEYKEANTKLVSSIEDNVSGLNLKVTSVETDVGELQTATAELTTRVSGAEASLTQKAEKTTVEDLSGKVSTIENAQASLSSRVDGAETALQQKAEKSTVEDLDNRVVTVETAQASLGTRVDDAEASLDQKAEKHIVTDLSGKVSAISNTQASLSSRVDGVETALEQKAEKTTVEDLDGRVDAIETAQTSLTTRVSGAETALEMVSQDVGDLQDASVEITSRVDLAEEQIGGKASKQELEAGLSAKVSNADLTERLKNYALASSLNDYLTVNAAAEQYVTSGGVTSIIGNYIVTDEKGTKKSLAQILADQISLQGRVDLTGSLSVENGVITSTGQIISQKNIRANTGLSSTKLELDTADIKIANIPYTPTPITSTSGTVMVLGTA